MKKRSFRKTSSILLIFLVFITAGILTFLYLSNTFSEQNLKAIDIKLISGEASLEEIGKEQLILSQENKLQLTQALTSVQKVDFKPEHIAHEYNMILTNSWGFTRAYTVLFTDDATVFLENHKENNSLLKVENPYFFYTYVSFHDIYKDLQIPTLQITLNKNKVSFEGINKNWSYLRHDGQWTEQEFNHINDKPNNSNVTITSSDDKLELIADKTPDYSLLKIVDLETNKVVLEDEIESNQLPYPNTNGRFDYILTLSWDHETYRGETQITVPVSISLPEKFVFAKRQIIQGDMLELVIYNAEKPEDIFIEQSIYKDFRLYKQDRLIRGYLPTNYSISPGKYEIKYGNRKKGTEFSYEVEIIPHDYYVQQLTINKQIEQETRNDEAYEEFGKYFNPVRKQSNSERYYSEPFILPTKGHLTTEFGQIRYVNGETTSSRHSGLDIGAPKGTEIKAANRGKVVLAMPLILTGNTIVIDHGEGLFSAYFHMNESLVHDGDIVERGQKIATVGTTGFSTGPHLHFIMSYYNMNIEPGFQIVGQPITFSNYQKFLLE